MNHKKITPILMIEESWANSPFSIARYYGSVRIDRHTYTICDKRGRTIFECSIEAERLGRDKAIEAGEPADLVRNDFIPLYKKLGRDTFIAILEANRKTDDKIIKEIMKKQK